MLERSGAFADKRLMLINILGLKETYRRSHKEAEKLVNALGDHIENCHITYNGTLVYELEGHENYPIVTQMAIEIPPIEGQLPDTKYDYDYVLTLYRKGQST